MSDEKYTGERRLHDACTFAAHRFLAEMEKGRPAPEAFADALSTYLASLSQEFTCDDPIPMRDESTRPAPHNRAERAPLWRPFE